MIAALRARYPAAQTFTMGDSAELCAQLNALVISGRKRATCGALADYEGASAEPMPEVGRRDIGLNWDGSPAFVIETTRLHRLRFVDVPENLALREGEDETLEGWRRGHKAFFDRNGGFSPDMMLLFEEFDLIEVVN